MTALGWFIVFLLGIFALLLIMVVIASCGQAKRYDVETENIVRSLKQEGD